MLVDGINVEVTGDGARTVVLLHGFSDNLTTWRRVVPPLAVGHRVIAIDLPGHGRTVRAWRRPLVPAYVDAVRDVLDALAVKGPVQLIGNSMGAVVATMFAATHPSRVESVVLIGMPGYHGVPRVWRAAVSRPATLAIRAAMAPIPQRRIQDGFAWVYAHAASPHPSLIDASALLGFSTPYDHRARVHRLSDLGRALIGELLHLRLADVVASLEAPVLQIWGRHDRLVPPHGKRTDERRVVLSDCGHCPQLDAPDRLMAVVLPFLDAAHSGARAGRPMRAVRS
jgi:pimeloyl-ACP methyl ester carboxylesterase